MNKKELLALIDKMQKSACIMADSEKETGNERYERFHRGMEAAYATVYMMLSNPKYAKGLAEIYRE